MEFTDDERRTLMAEADLLDRVATLATLPGLLLRSEIDDALRAVDVPPGDARCGGGRRLPRPRSSCWAV